MKTIALLITLLLTGCQSLLPTTGPHVELARAAVGVAVASHTLAVTEWDYPLPLIEPPSHPALPDRVAEDEPAESIEWVSPAEARRTGKPIFWLVVHPDPDACPPCIVAKRMLTDPEVVELSQQWACVMTSRVKGQENPAYPQAIFQHGERIKGHQGLPESYAALLRDAYEELTRAEPVAQTRPWPRYPVRGNWWSGCSSWRHLTVGPHAGKYHPGWLQTLSWSELQSLHSDCHEGRVKTQFVVRPS